MRRDFPLSDSVAFVSDEHYRCGAGGAVHYCWGGERGGKIAASGGGAGAGGFFDALDLVVEFLDAGEGGAGGYAVDEDEAFAVSNPLVAEGGVFFLAGGVEDFEHAGLVVYDDLFSVGVFDCRVVGFDEVV